MFQAKLALDLGTSLGYSSHVLAQIVGQDGSVLSVEREPALARRARENLKKTGMDKRVAVIMGEADEVMRELTGPYDIILLDVDKAQYLDLFDRIVELLAVGGHLIVDDVGFLSRDFDPRLRPLALHIARFVKALLQHPGMESIYIPLGDGLVLARRLPPGEEKQLSMFGNRKEAEPADASTDQKGVNKPTVTEKPASTPSEGTVPRNLATSVGIIKPQKTDS
ncbi:class I SAM-dependent methyltransferase [bacterium]|nr:class I SAM-dependent methyltransferase [bacterium]